MSNIAGKAYAMNVVTPMPPRWSWVNRFLFFLARVLPSNLKGLLGLSLIHFARWVVIRRDQWPDLGQGGQRLKNDYMLFCSNFNGTWDQYIDAFSDGIPNGLDLFWYSSRKYPHSIPITPFKDYIVHNQIDTTYYYNAVPGSAQRDIKCALRVRRAINALAEQHAHLGAEAFAVEYHRALATVQNALGAPGYAPIASNDTEAAAINRQPYIEQRWHKAPGRQSKTLAEQPGDPILQES